MNTPVAYRAGVAHVDEYRPRAAADSVLHTVVRQHFETFLQEAARHAAR